MMTIKWLLLTQKKRIPKESSFFMYNKAIELYMRIEETILIQKYKVKEFIFTDIAFLYLEIL